MLRLLILCAVLCGCDVSVAGAGTSGDVSWAFTINNTQPSSGVQSGGLIVIVSYADGSSASYVVAAGSSLSLTAEGASVRVQGGGSSATAGPGGTLYYTGSGWTSTPPRPVVAN
jgi:hypothetical protein